VQVRLVTLPEQEPLESQAMRGGDGDAVPVDAGQEVRGDAIPVGGQALRRDDDMLKVEGHHEHAQASAFPSAVQAFDEGGHIPVAALVAVPSSSGAVENEGAQAPRELLLHGGAEPAEGVGASGPAARVSEARQSTTSASSALLVAEAPTRVPCPCRVSQWLNEAPCLGPEHPEVVLAPA
jgi:hypothetical protein